MCAVGGSPLSRSIVFQLALEVLVPVVVHEKSSPFKLLHIQGKKQLKRSTLLSEISDQLVVVGRIKTRLSVFLYGTESNYIACFVKRKT